LFTTLPTAGLTQKTRKGCTFLTSVHLPGHRPWVAQQLQDEFGTVYPPCTTDRETVSGGSLEDGMPFEAMKSLIVKEGLRQGLSEGAALDLFSRYGSNTMEIYHQYIQLNERNLTAEEQLLYAEIRYCVDQEMTVKSIDFLLRRTGWLLFDRQKSERLSAKTITFLGELLGWDDLQKDEERTMVREQLEKTTFRRRIV
jgi:glycerol-3-phosphate dehydrogenase